ncbi:hypothetical protein D3C81_2135850 [compost metagenome]
MAFRPPPKNHGISAELDRHILNRQDRSVGDMAGYDRRAITYDSFPYFGPQAIRAN